jgi:penicillin-binding protein 1A
MRTLIRVSLFCIGAVVLLFATGLLWLHFYSRDLPDIGALANFAPMTVTRAYDPCLKHESLVIPYDSIGSNLRNALNAAEVREDDPGVPMGTFRSFTDHALHRATLSMQISRTLFCTPSRPFQRQLAELRAAAQLERRFSRRELFTIYTNRAYFGEDLNGAQAAAQHLFHKNADELDVGEAALLAGLIKSPSLYSPIKHPDRALVRRNQVIDAMIANGSLRSSDGGTAKTSQLGVATVLPNSVQ